MNSKLKTVAKNWGPQLLSAIVMLALVVVATRGLWRPELIRSFDMEFHAARTANYYLALKQGQLPPRWAPNLNSSFGYPVFLMVYPLPYLLSTSMFLLTHSVEWSLNLVIIASMLMAGSGMWGLGWWLTHRPGPALLAAWWYALSPYLLMTVYVKGAVAEMLFLGVLPWVWLALLTKQFQKQVWWQVLAYLSFMAALLAHHLSIIILAPVILSWLAVTKEKSWRVWAVGAASVATVMFFWWPMVVEKQFTRVARDEMVQHYYEDFVSFTTLVWSSWGYGGFSPNVEHEGFTQMLGWGSWLMVSWAGLAIFWKKIRPHHTWPGWFWLSWLVISILVMTSISQPVWEVLSFLKFLQFPWRFLWLGVFSGVMVFLYLEQSLAWPRFLRLLTYLTVGSWALWTTIFWAKPVGYFGHDTHYWLEYPGKSSSFSEFDTIWWNPVSNPRLTDPVATRPLGERVFDDSEQREPHRWGQVEVLQWSGHSMEYQVTLPEAGHVIQRTMYFPGWKVTVDGKPTEINWQDDEFSGRVVFPVTAGDHLIRAEFTNQLWDRRLADALSLIGVLAVSGLWLYSAISHVKVTHHTAAPHQPSQPSASSKPATKSVAKAKSSKPRSTSSTPPRR